MKLNRPYQIQIEPVYGCNRKCDFCVLSYVEDSRRPFYMNNATFSLILSSINCFNPTKIEFGGRGEPTMHPEWVRYVGLVRAQMPDTMINTITNGDYLNTELISAYFKNGGNALLVDCYDPKLIDKRKKSWNKFDVVMLEQGESPYNRNTKLKTIYLMESVSTITGGVTRGLDTQAGYLGSPSILKYNLPCETLAKKCVRPFRELVIRVNGYIDLCCKDWGGTVRLKRCAGKSLENFWYNDIRLNNIRALLYEKNRSFAPCDKCTFNGGVRQGLLPKLENKGSAKLINALYPRKHVPTIKQESIYG